MIEVMIDLETLSVESNAAIISIGAVKFDPRGPVGELGDTLNPDYKHFHATVDFHSVTEAEFHIEGNTVRWWFEQGDEARHALLQDQAHIGDVLSRFWTWFGDVSLPTWGNGAGFDNVILRNAYQKLGGVSPYNFSHDRCFRTMKALFPDVAYVGPAVAHNALQDAEAQAIHLQKLFNFIATK
jgi:hypothetical protein